MTIKLSSQITDSEKRYFDVGFTEGREAARQKAGRSYAVLIVLLSFVGALAVGALAGAVTWGGLSNWFYACFAVVLWAGIAIIGWLVISTS
ncbi:flagellar basal body-associated protein FliL [Brevundimonas sp. UYEF29]|uniref:hypothetical protein n=1 Tax=Brevundimonas sp. UYEF29 TaxID=3156346 RepID=UPI002592D842|nr:hypothetical protein [uncultured Brevundimonas sp.]